MNYDKRNYWKCSNNKEMNSDQRHVRKISMLGSNRKSFFSSDTSKLILHQGRFIYFLN